MQHKIKMLKELIGHMDTMEGDRVRKKKQSPMSMPLPETHEPEETNEMGNHTASEDQPFQSEKMPEQPEDKEAKKRSILKRLGKI